MRTILLSGLTGLALLATVPASAQIMGTNNITAGAPNSGRPSQTRREPGLPPPPAVPGSRVEANDAAPAERSPSEMPPTDALFDAINRGDLNGAKDAISRGADLSGRNVLGLTPLELSVDLGRNSISFMLLSYRGASGYGGGGAAAASAPATPNRQASRSERRAAERAERAAERAERAPTRQVTERIPAPAPAPQTPRLFAGDGGTPVPQAGFLGFGSAR